MTWEKLSNFKESYPAQVAEYACGNGIIYETTFVWWAPYILKKRRAILLKVKTKYWSCTRKYRVRVTKSIGEARRLDKENGNTLWQYAIDTEMTNNAIPFYIRPHQASGQPAAPPVGYKKLGVNMIFDVKLDAGFTRKARLVADGHNQDVPTSMNYLSVVSRDSVRIALTLVALNCLDLNTADVQNTYLNAKPKGRVYFYAGTEFGKDEGKLVIVVRALYGLKGDVSAWAVAIHQCMRNLGFTPCVADGDVWMQEAVDTSNLESNESA